MVTEALGSSPGSPVRPWTGLAASLGFRFWLLFCFFFFKPANELLIILAFPPARSGGKMALGRYISESCFSNPALDLLPWGLLGTSQSLGSFRDPVSQQA